MHIGILQAGHVMPGLAEEHGQYSDMFRRFLADRGFDFTTWSVVDDEFPGGPNDAEGWLVTGSRHGVYEGFPWIDALEAFLRDCYAAAVPVVGICFGHQVLARALGGKVEKHAEGWGIGRNTYRTGEGEISLNAWHQDQVVEPPEGAEVIGSSDFCKYAMLSYGNRGLSFQPHPEFSSAFVEGLIEKRGVGVIPSEILDRARDDLDKEVQEARIAEQIADFLLNARRREAAAAP